MAGPHLKVISPAAPAGRRRAGSAETAPDGSGDSTDRIVEAIVATIVERRLMPGTKLAEQKIADIFKLSRTVVRKALNRLSRDRLVTLAPVRGAFVPTPSVEAARQVCEARQMIDLARHWTATHSFDPHTARPWPRT